MEIKLKEFLLQFLIATTIFITAFTLLPILLLFFLLLKTVVYFCAKIFRKDLSHFMPMVSSLWACGDEIDKNPKINVVYYFIFNGHIELDKLRTIFEERVLQKLKPNGGVMYQELQMYWTTFCNYIFWTEDKNFDLQNHIRLYDYEESDLQLPKDGSCEEKHLNNILGPLLKKSYKENRSPWEILLVQNFQSPQDENSKPLVKNSLKSKSRSVLILRIHHALVDGYSIMKLIVRDLMQEPVNININFPKMGKLESIGFNTILPLKLAWDMAGEILHTFDGGNCWNFWSFLNFRKKKLSGQLWTSISPPMDAQLIKNVKNKYGVTYNDVLCAISANVSIQLMEKMGQIVPNEMSCSTPLPLPNHPDGAVNHLSWQIYKLPMNTKLNMEQRLQIISKRKNISKYFTTPLGYNLLAKFLNLTPSFFVKLMRKTPFTICWTSYPFPSRLCEFKTMGVELTDVMLGVGPGDGTAGTGMNCLSYNGKQRITASINQSYFPNENIFENFGAYFEEELNKYFKKIR